MLPRIFRTADEPVFRDILQRRPEVASAAIGNLGHLAIVKELGQNAPRRLRPERVQQPGGALLAGAGAVVRDGQL